MSDKPSYSREVPETRDAHFIKSNYFRVVHADGAWGGLTPNGALQLAFYNERHPIPRVVHEKLVISGNVVRVDECGREGKAGVVREVEVDIVLTIDAAKNLRDFLTRQLDIIEKLESKPPNKQQN
jgi:hypothetical protein